MQKERKVLLGFGLTLIGVTGALGIYLPRYSTMAQVGRDRTSRSRGPAEKNGDTRAQSSTRSSSTVHHTETKQE
ncbi:unnamed protein product [Hyaloperonospora brassicae]|uniref:RxLR effector candidate protein n=1 Tax=Hyaloperonospora brassicae TaxID=162125 RepID=A0AAV0T732_HYABA|nr:unnamed protein product [Hyaloperonospora brassicae]